MNVQEARPDTQTYWRQKNRRCLTRLPKRKQDNKTLIAVDIETGRPGEHTLGGSLVLGAWVSEADPTRTTYFTTVAEWVEAIFRKENRGSVWVAHNGGEYDYKYLIEYLVEHKDEYPGLEQHLICRRDGRIIAIQMKRNKQKYLLMDSYALIPDALKRVTRALAPETVKKDRAWTNADGSVHYFDPDSAEDRAYLETDVRGLLVAVRRFKDTIYDLFRVNTSYTAGGTAMRAWRSTLPSDAMYWRQHKAVEAMGREAYKGGLIVLTRNDRQEDMAHVDVNAMYAWAMMQGVPVGRGIYVNREVKGYPAIYRVRITVPDSERYPFIGTNDATPLRPRGTFETTVTSIELVEARKRGYPYTVTEGYYFEELANPFHDFLTLAQALEMEHKGDALGYAVKIMRNSLYGKFGSKPEGIAYLITDDPKDDLTPVIDPRSGQFVPYLYSRAETIDEPYLQPVWAAFITANARIRLSQLATKLEGVYGDTDSVVFPARKLDKALKDGTLRVSKVYGDVKVEHVYRWFQAGGPKNYMAETAEGEIIDKAKGIPKSLGLQEQITVKVDGERHTVHPVEAHRLALAGHIVEVNFLSMNSTMAMLKNGKGKAEDRHRSFSLLDHSIQWVADGSGAVFAVKMPESALPDVGAG